MQKISLFIIAAVISVTWFSGCTKKSNTINNGQVIETPYALYFADTAGAVYLSNDGSNIAKTLLPPDGQPVRAMITSGMNLLVVKPEIYYEVNNAVNFNLSYPYPANYLHYGANGKLMTLDQTMIVDIPSWSHVFVASNGDPSPNDLFNMSWSAQNGAVGQWAIESYYDTDQITNLTNVHVNSFTYLQKGTLVAHDTLNRIFYRDGITVDYRWKESTGISSMLSSTGYWSLGHIANRLIAIDTRGNLGAYYSDDEGTTWTSLPGLPPGVPLLSISSPFEQLCFVGTDGKGVYVLNQGTTSFQPASSGLGDVSVRGITFKENIYKNDTRQQYVYLATDKGLYRSTDMGLNWTKTLSGNFVAAY